MQDPHPPCVITLQSHASFKTHERAPSEQRLTSDMMRDAVGGGLNATLSDYLMTHAAFKSLWLEQDGDLTFLYIA